MPRDIPVIFSGPMVRALLDGRKTMTRRLAWLPRRKIKKGNSAYSCPSPWQKIQGGDRLWVRENFSGPHDYSAVRPDMWHPSVHLWYWADGQPSDGDWTRPKPSIHMPRWVSRLTLVVTETKIERLQDVSERDAAAEGWQRNPTVSDDPEVHRDAARDWFNDLWCSLHGNHSWLENPEVVALSFRVIRANIDAPEAKVA